MHVPFFDTRLRKNLDKPLIVLTLLVAAMGFVAIYSATHYTTGQQYKKQLLWFPLAIAGMIAAASFDYTRLTKYARPIYIVNFLLLLIVFKFKHAKGSQRWIPIGSFHLQPSEIAKICLIVCLAVYLVNRMDTLRDPKTLLGSLVYAGAPMLLVFAQPDLGTALVLAAIWFGMTFIAGARLIHLGIILLSAVLLFGGMWKLNVLKTYQKNRLMAFMDSAADPRGAGYQVQQSRIAVGSGQVWGKGLGHGTQARGRFIPENQTDFIYTIVGEEAGFVGSALLVLLYGGILYRGVATIAQAEDTLGKLLAAGVVSMYAFHVIVNIGMTIGIMPVTGVPLPLFSYGGSSLIVNMTCIGLLLGIGMRKHQLTF